MYTKNYKIMQIIDITVFQPVVTIVTLWSTWKHSKRSAEFLSTTAKVCIWFISSWFISLTLFNLPRIYILKVMGFLELWILGKTSLKKDCCCYFERVFNMTNLRWPTRYFVRWLTDTLKMTNCLTTNYLRCICVVLVSERSKWG